MVAAATPTSAGPGLAFRPSSSQLVRQFSSSRRELERTRIDAVALARGWRTVREHMSLMRAAARADNLDPHHSIARVPKLPKMSLDEGRGKARPTGAAFKF